MLRRSREEDTKDIDGDSIETLLRREIVEMQKSIHHMQMRIKELAEDNYRLKEENANIHNN
jgi:FtsZ-binding cell division protein ZapB